MHAHSDHEWEQVRAHIRDHMKTLFGIEDSSGLELFVLLQRTAHLSRMLDDQLGEDMDLSGPRWRLLLRLLVEEELGNPAGLTPTVLSQSQRVSKNTISALLRGLEAQGLVQRTLDSTDLRAFRIQLTLAGREYLHKTVPERMQGLNRLLSGLDPQEKERLTALLEKLQRSLTKHCQQSEKDHGTASAHPESVQKV